MEYAIFPMQTISISQAYKEASHRAWDINGADTGKNWWYAPCRVKVLAIFPYNFVTKTGFYNTVLFGSCDESGNQAEVMCEDGVARVLTFGCTHMDEAEFNSMNYQVGNQYASGTACYCEGFTGLDENNPLHGNHVHMDVAVGWHYQRIYDETNHYHFPEEYLLREDGGTIIGNCFHQLNGFNTVGNQGTGIYSFSSVSSRTVPNSEESEDDTNDEGSTNSTSITGYALYTSKAGVNIRTAPNTTSTIVTTVPKGNELKIKRFIDGFQTDNWQWAEVYYNGYEGYSRVETLNSYTVVKTNTSVMVPGSDVCVVPRTLYLIMSSSGGYIRTSIPSGSRRFIPAGTPVQVTELINTVQTDGYQWVKAIYNGEEGYIQADTYNWHYFKI